VEAGRGLLGPRGHPAGSINADEARMKEDDRCQRATAEYSTTGWLPGGPPFLWAQSDASPQSRHPKSSLHRLPACDCRRFPAPVDPQKGLDAAGCADGMCPLFRRCEATRTLRSSATGSPGTVRNRDGNARSERGGSGRGQGRGGRGARVGARGRSQREDWLFTVPNSGPAHTRPGATRGGSRRFASIFRTSPARSLHTG